MLVFVIVRKTLVTAFGHSHRWVLLKHLLFIVYPLLAIIRGAIIQVLILEKHLNRGSLLRLRCHHPVDQLLEFICSICLIGKLDIAASIAQ